MPIKHYCKCGFTVHTDLEIALEPHWDIDWNHCPECGRTLVQSTEDGEMDKCDHCERDAYKIRNEQVDDTKRVELKKCMYHYIKIDLKGFPEIQENRSQELLGIPWKKAKQKYEKKQG